MKQINLINFLTKELWNEKQLFMDVYTAYYIYDLHYRDIYNNVMKELLQKTECLKRAIDCTKYPIHPQIFDFCNYDQILDLSYNNYTYNIISANFFFGIVWCLNMNIKLTNNNICKFILYSTGEGRCT